MHDVWNRCSEEQTLVFLPGTCQVELAGNSICPYFETHPRHITFFIAVRRYDTITQYCKSYAYSTIQKIMTTVTANNLKVYSISSIEKSLKDYDELRENEILAAWLQVRQDIKEGRFVEESADAHMARIRTELSNEL